MIGYMINFVISYYSDLLLFLSHASALFLTSLFIIIILIVKRGIYVAGLKEEIVNCPEQVLDLMKFGECNCLLI